jgi:type II secretory pathway component PulM
MSTRRKGELSVKKLPVLAVVIALTLWDTRPGLAQAPSEELKGLKKEMQLLKEGQAAIQKELQEIKTLLRARPAAAPADPQNVVLSVEGAPFKGDKRAKVTLVDFSDYQ